MLAVFTPSMLVMFSLTNFLIVSQSFTIADMRMSSYPNEYAE
jgi:hypothetical protein